jgi:hypothetical protein
LCAVVSFALSEIAPSESAERIHALPAALQLRADRSALAHCATC